jgi:hypothetical protein
VQFAHEEEGRMNPQSESERRKKIKVADDVFYAQNQHRWNDIERKGYLDSRAIRIEQEMGRKFVLQVVVADEDYAGNISDWEDSFPQLTFAKFSTVDEAMAAARKLSEELKEKYAARQTG